MTVLISIGQKRVDDSDPEGVYVEADLEEAEFSPKSDGVSGSTNRRHHAAFYMYNMMRMFNLSDWERDNFYELGPGYGHKVATVDDLAIMRQKRAEFIARGGEEEDLEFIDFFIFWIDWALDNCEDPIISFN